MAQQEIIREYLVKLGYTVDKTEQKDFDKSIVSSEKVVGFLSKTILGAAAAVTAMAAKFATSMDALYYSSQKAASSAANLKAYEYAGRQIGLTSEAIDQMVGSLAMTLRTDPGMKGWVESLGVSADESRQGVDVWMDLMSKLREKPFYEGRQFAEMIGMSPDQFFQIETNYDDFRAKVQERLKMAQSVNLDQDAAARRGRELANQAGHAAEMAGILLDKGGQEAAPTLLSAGKKLSEAGDALLRLTKGQPLTAEQVKMNDPNHPWWAKHSDSAAPAKSLLGSQPQWLTDFINRWKGNDGRGALGGKTTQMQDTMDALERVFNLPSGELDRIWKKESNRGDPRFMQSSAGAQGHFGFMPKTAAQYGVTDPNDFNNSAQGAARYLSDLKKKYGGDMSAAEAAYNWGPANYDRYLGARAQGKSASMPKETQDYISRPITVVVNESKTPAATAAAVARKLDSKINTAAADQQRYVTGAVR